MKITWSWIVAAFVMICLIITFFASIGIRTKEMLESVGAEQQTIIDKYLNNGKAQKEKDNQ